MDYYACGGTMSSYINGNTVDKYKFTGKERDSETGLDYFGARYYSSILGRWLSIDPMADKYPGISPYNYCANNPLNIFDPDGREIRIATGVIGPDGREEYIEYHPGMKYKGNSSFVAKMINALNAIALDNKGETVIKQLVRTKTIFSFGNVPSSVQGTMQFTRGNGQFDIRAANIMKGSDLGNIKDIAHELFHGYQVENGRDYTTSNAEVESYLFGQSMMASTNILHMFTEFRGAPGKAGSDYTKAMNALLYSKRFDSANFNKASSNFAKGNPYGYRNHNYSRDYKPLIKGFFPLINKD